MSHKEASRRKQYSWKGMSWSTRYWHETRKYNTTTRARVSLQHWEVSSKRTPWLLFHFCSSFRPDYSEAMEQPHQRNLQNNHVAHEPTWRLCLWAWLLPPNSPPHRQHIYDVSFQSQDSVWSLWSCYLFCKWSLLATWVRPLGASPNDYELRWESS